MKVCIAAYHLQRLFQIYPDKEAVEKMFMWITKRTFTAALEYGDKRVITQQGIEDPPDTSPWAGADLDEEELEFAKTMGVQRNICDLTTKFGTWDLGSRFRYLHLL